MQGASRAKEAGLAAAPRVGRVPGEEEGAGKAVTGDSKSVYLCGPRTESFPNSSGKCGEWGIVGPSVAHTTVGISPVGCLCEFQPPGRQGETLAQTGKKIT